MKKLIILLFFVCFAFIGNAQIPYKIFGDVEIYGKLNVTDIEQKSGILTYGDTVLVVHRDTLKYMIFVYDTSCFDLVNTTEIITKSGITNVGMGTTNPAEKLDVIGGNIAISNNKYYHLRNNSGSVGGGMSADPSNRLILKIPSTGTDIYFQDAAGNTMGCWEDNGSVGYFGIGTTDPEANVHINTGAVAAIFERNEENTSSASIKFQKSRGTSVAKTQIQVGDILGQLQFTGYGDDANWDYGSVLRCEVEAIRTGTDNYDVAGNFIFKTTNTSFANTERMRLTSDGDLGVGTDAPGERLDVAGNIQISNGSHYYINDTIFGGRYKSNYFIGTTLPDLAGGTFNSLFGQNAGYKITSGGNNVFFGAYAGYTLTSGIGNVKFGYFAGYKNNGNSNVFIGYETGKENLTGSANVYIGSQAGKNNIGTSNLFLGHNAGSTMTSSTGLLFIANTSTVTPLLYGNFSTPSLEINGSLEVTTTTGALIVPRLTTTQRGALTPVNGMIIYNTTDNAFNFYENSGWVTK